MSDIDTVLNTAFAAYNAADFEQAEALARHVLSITPTQGDALYLLGLIAFQSGALEPAESLLYQAVQLYPHQASYQLALASILERRGCLDEALRLYQKYPQNSQALVQIGLIQAQKKQFSFAAHSFKKALNINPDNQSAVIGLAQLNRAKGKMALALAELKTVSAADRQAETAYQLALQLRLMHRYKQALGYINEAVKKQPLPAFLNEQGIILKALHKLDESESSFRQAVLMDNAFADGWMQLGDLNLMQEKWMQAEENYKRALQVNPALIDARTNLGFVLYRSGRITEALEQYRTALQHNPHFVPALYQLAVLLEEQGDFEEALGLYFNIVVSKDEHLKALDFRIADTLTKLYQSSVDGIKKAQLFAQGWVKNFPDNPVAGHMAAALSGQESTQAVSFSKKLYHVFADTYDERMKTLKSTVVKSIKLLIKNEKYKNILDLGCGTGSCGRFLKKQATSVTGVDISEDMLKLSKKTKSYTHLECQEAILFLTHTKKRFDLIVASELVCYLPDIMGFIHAVNQALTPAGTVVFSVESGQDKLMPNGRYGYSKKMVMDILEKSGFQVLDVIDVALRLEGQGHADGFIVKAIKN